MDLFAETNLEDIHNLGIGSDCVENVLWDISLLHTTLFVIIHFGTNNVDQKQQRHIVFGIMKISKTLTKNHLKINTIITCMLPRDNIYSFLPTTIDETDKILKAECKNLLEIYFINQDDN